MAAENVKSSFQNGGSKDLDLLLRNLDLDTENLEDLWKAGHPRVPLDVMESAWKNRKLYEGIVMPDLIPGNKPWNEKIEDLRRMKLRDDDVMLFTFPKTGRLRN